MKKTLVRKAQANEYMYSVLKENGIAVRLDEYIGIDFISIADIS